MNGILPFRGYYSSKNIHYVGPVELLQFTAHGRPRPTFMGCVEVTFGDIGTAAPDMSNRKSRKSKAKKSSVASGKEALPAPTSSAVNALMDRFNAGDLESAEACARELSEKHPYQPIGWKGLGAVLHAKGRSAEALPAIQRAAELSPSDFEIHNNLGLALQSLGSFAEASDSYRKAIELKFDFASAHNNLGNVLNLLGCGDEAEKSYRYAIELKPDYAEAYNNLGTVLQDLLRLEESEVSLRQAIALNANYAKAHSNLGLCLVALGRYEEAEKTYRRAAYLDPNLPDCHINLGQLLAQMDRLDEALMHLKAAIQLNPNIAAAHNNLGAAVKDLGWAKEAALCYREAIRLRPDYSQARSNLLFSLNYDENLSAAELFTEYEAYGAWARSWVEQKFSHSARSYNKKPRLRIGYSSPDLRGHACRFFMEPLFRNHDHRQFELFAYSNTAKEDEHTERLKQYFDHWIDVVRLSDEEMAGRIYEDQIDILVDMAGHTNGNRLLVFAMRPAPVQVSSNIGYGYTSGLKEIDFFLGNENLTPSGSEEFFSEQIYRLPAPGYAYEPPRAETPDVCELPALRKGYVTFGSCSRTVRLNDPLLRVWGEVLERIPTSRLRLDQKCFRSQGVRDFFWQRLEGLGVPRDRVELTCSEPHWLGFQEIDITLDTWPHNSGTTLLESLWMGVPVLSKTDRASVGCIGAATLRPLGLQDWVVEGEEAFIERAVAAASDLKALTSLRSELRERLEQGPHMDAITVTQNIEAAYQQMINELRV